MSVRIDCWCITCDATVREAQVANGDTWAAFDRRFIVCPDCGNKRCPKATQHDNACTGSNEPGQAGSAYARRGVSDISCRHCGHRYGWRGGISFAAMCELGRLARKHQEDAHPDLVAAHAQHDAAETSRPRGNEEDER